MLIDSLTREFTLSVIVPAYNEERTIRRILDKILAVPIKMEVIVIDDLSTDGTYTVLKEYEKRGLIKTIFHDRNRGKGAAIRSGLEAVSGDIVLIQDADLEYEPDDYHALIQPILEGRTNVVYGSRNLIPENKHSYFSFYVGGRLLSALANFLYGSSITDEPTCYKVFRTSLLKEIPLRCERFEFCPEVTAKVLRRGETIVEVPIRYYPRKKGEGKKIRWRDGFVAIWTLIRYRFSRV